MTDELLSSCVLPHLNNAVLSELLDSAVLEAGRERVALTIDSYVVTPLEFPGGDIGKLAVCGTVNDLTMVGARPLGLALAVVAQEGLEQALLDRIIRSVGEMARAAGVNIVTGDTKVVERGVLGAQGPGLILTTAGVGLLPISPEAERHLDPRRVRPGDMVLITGRVAEHGLAVMLARHLPEAEIKVQSDVAPLNGLMESLWGCAEVQADPAALVFLRDPTRGGLSGLAADLAQRARVRVVLEEEVIPVAPAVRHAAGLLGLDLLEVANEGKAVLVVRPEAAQAVLAALRRHALGRDAAIIGRIEPVPDGGMPGVELITTIGGRRLIQKPFGEQVARIC